MNPVQGTIQAYAKQLRLPTLTQYSDVIRDAEQNHWGYEEFLAELLRQEIAQRQENQRLRRLKGARFPMVKTLDTFDFKQLPHVREAQVWHLASGEYIERNEDVVLIGPPGTGKTHLAIALGTAGCHQGYNVRFWKVSDLVTELAEAVQNYRLSKLEKQIGQCRLLILDELSYLTLSKQQAEMLFQLISTRTERSSTIITTNLEFSRWTEIFGDNLITAAVVDRLTYRSHVFNMNAESFRLKSRVQAMTPMTLDGSP